MRTIYLQKINNNSSNSIISLLFVLYHNRHLLFQMTRREVSARYRGSILGLAWSFINPILMLFVYTFVFSVVFKARWGTDPNESRVEFAMILFAGMVIFNLFSEVFNRSPGLILSNVNYVKKVVFPLEILPFVALGSALFHSFTSLGALMLVQLMLKHSLPWTIVFLPVIFLPLVFGLLGIGWFLSALGVYVRDIGQVTGVLTTVLMFFSNVFYPLSALPERYQSLLKLNPLVVIISECRQVLIYGLPPNWVALGNIFFIGILMSFVGYSWFQKSRKGFADVI